MIVTRTIQVALIMLLILVWGHEQSVAQSGKFRKTKISIDQGGKSKFHWENDRHLLKVEFEGGIEWENDDSGIKSMSRGSYLKIEERMRGEKHQLTVEATSNADLDYSYRHNGKRHAFDEDAQEWLAEVLPMFIRESGIGAESRTKRIMEIEGVEGVLEEVDKISSPSVKVLYLLYMFEYAEADGMTGEEAVKAAQVAASISSPGDKTRFLKATARTFFMHEEAIEPFFGTVRSISSPGDKARLLLHLVEENLLNESRPYILAIETAKTISSPGDKARFMKAAVPFYVSEANESYFETVNTISSPGDHARVLTSLLDEASLDNEAMGYLLRSAKNVSSPGDKARVLMDAANYMGDQGTSDEVMQIYLDVTRTVSTPGDKARVLIRVFEEAELSDASMLRWFDVVRTVNTPGDKALVLLKAADEVDNNDALVEAYIEVAETVSTPGDRRRVLEALLD